MKPYRSLHLQQKPHALQNRKERWKLWQGMMWLLSRKQDSSYLEEHEGIQLLDLDAEYCCVTYAIGEEDITTVIERIQEHKGIPEEQDVVVYGYKVFPRTITDLYSRLQGQYLFVPQHMGVWQADGTVISKWGNRGPLVRHRWDQVLPDFGNKMLFSTYKADPTLHAKVLRQE